MKRSAMPKRRTGLHSIGAKALRERDDLSDFRQALATRSGGLCEIRTPACPPGPHRGVHAHHCAPSDRDRGEHLPERGLYLCARAHDFVHRFPAESYERGWLIRSAS